MKNSKFDLLDEIYYRKNKNPLKFFYINPIYYFTDEFSYYVNRKKKKKLTKFFIKNNLLDLYIKDARNDDKYYYMYGENLEDSDQKYVDKENFASLTDDIIQESVGNMSFYKKNVTKDINNLIEESEKLSSNDEGTVEGSVDDSSDEVEYSDVNNLIEKSEKLSSNDEGTVEGSVDDSSDEVEYIDVNNLIEKSEKLSSNDEGTVEGSVDDSSDEVEYIDVNNLIEESEKLSSNDEGTVENSVDDSSDEVEYSDVNNLIEESEKLSSNDEGTVEGSVDDSSENAEFVDKYMRSFYSKTDHDLLIDDTSTDDDKHYSNTTESINSTGNTDNFTMYSNDDDFTSEEIVKIYNNKLLTNYNILEIFLERYEYTDFLEILETIKYDIEYVRPISIIKEVDAYVNSKKNINIKNNNSNLNLVNLKKKKEERLTLAFIEGLYKQDEFNVQVFSEFFFEDYYKDNNCIDLGFYYKISLKIDFYENYDKIILLLNVVCYKYSKQFDDRPTNKYSLSF
jgi:hypothetical protein